MLDFLPRSIVRAIEEEAEKKGLSPEAVLVDLLARLVPVEERWRAYLEAAETSVEHALREAGEGRLEEACRRLWSAVLLLFSSVSLREEGREVGEVGGYWSVVERAGSGLGEEFYLAWYSGLAARVMLAEGVVSRGHVEAIAGVLKRAISKYKEA